MTYLLALDQGTSSSRSILFDANGTIVSMAQQEFRQIYPHPGWVEHDPLELWNSQWATARAALNKAGLKAQDVAGIGITNQRETTIVWNRRTGEPVYNAIVWQDRRAEPACSILRERGYGEQVQRTTGLVIDAYFSATKLQWILDSVPGAREAATRGELAFGTVDCWLLWKLTGGRKHATDVSNAARTMLFDIHRNTWDEDLLKLFNIPAAVLPAVHPSAWQYGETDPEILGAAVRIGGMAGDQQSALFGQACFQPGLAKNTYGTGCFMLLHTGAQSLNSANGLITTSTAQTSTTPTFALEGSVFIGGAVVQWLRDGLGVIERSSDVQSLADSVPDSGGVVFVPAFTGLGAPYWRADARGAILGLTRGVTAAHIARAALESIAFQSAALLLAMSRDAIAAGGQAVQELRVDGGACANNLLMQFQADLLGIPVVRPQIIETTALGAAWLAALGLGIHGGTDALESQWRIERRFEPRISRDEASARMAQWERAVAQLLTAPERLT
jgi:glycerol kinase